MPDEWVNTSFRYANRTRKLHTDPDCQYVTADSTPIEDARIDREQLEECDYCAGNIRPIQQTDQVCPFCEETVPQLPGHLPCDETP